MPENLTPWTDPELEARVVALVLGEASDFERDQLREIIAGNAELAAFQKRMDAIHGLLLESCGRNPETGTDSANSWQLPDPQRQPLLDVLSTASAPKPSPAPKRRVRLLVRPAFWWSAAACFVIAAIAALSIPTGDMVMHCKSPDGRGNWGMALPQSTAVVTSAPSAPPPPPAEEPAAATSSAKPALLARQEHVSQLGKATSSRRASSLAISGEQIDHLLAQPDDGAPDSRTASSTAGGRGSGRSSVGGTVALAEGKLDAQPKPDAAPRTVPFIGSVKMGYESDYIFRGKEEAQQFGRTLNRSAGNATLDLNGTNTYTGGVTVNSGTAIGSGGIVKSGAGTLTINGGAFTSSGVVSGQAAPSTVQLRIDGNDKTKDKVVRSDELAIVPRSGAEKYSYSSAMSPIAGKSETAALPQLTGKDLTGYISKGGMKDIKEPASSVPEAAKKAVARRQESVSKADEAALRGGRMLATRDYEGAVDELKKSVDLVPDAPVLASRKKEYSDQLANAKVELARKRAEEGRYNEASSLVASVAKENPSSEASQKAKQLFKDLNEPEIYSPAVTPEHIQKVKQIELAQKTAEGHARIGDYDGAEKNFKKVLDQDPYNSAARKGLEEVERQRKQYFDTANDHTRAKFLGEINKQWESSAPESNVSDLKTEKTGQPDPSDVWLKAFGLTREGEEKEKANSALEALAKYQEAQWLFDELARSNPNWKANMIAFRRKGILDKIEKLREELKQPEQTEANLLAKNLAEKKTESIPEIATSTEPFSTFSLHVSDVSFKLAKASLAEGKWPDPSRIRIEEFVNAFDYGDPSPAGSEPVACALEQSIHPFQQARNLLRISLRTASAGRGSSTPLRLTLLLDSSGSMERADRRETLQAAISQLAGQLKADDRVTLVTFARQPRLQADQLPGDQAKTLPQIIANTPSEGGTNLEAALKLATEKAREHFQANAQNRIVLLTDGAANLGDANPERLSQAVEAMRRQGIAFDTAGIGADGLNDTVLEALSRKGDGRYYLLDSPDDAGANFAAQLAGAFRPAAKNVKVQVWFNPDRVRRYRLLGFEEHRLEKEDFRNDSVDAAELAAAEAGVAMYQFEPLPEGAGDIGYVSVRFQEAASGQMIERRWPISYEANPQPFEKASAGIRLAASAAFLAAKLGDDPLASRIDLSVLDRAAANEDLRTLIHQTRNLSTTR